MILRAAKQTWNIRFAQNQAVKWINNIYFNQ